jgi:probable phosphoglycerate mutase
MSGATRLVLVRHGEALCNVEAIVGGPRGCTGLTPTGIRQAEALRRRLSESGELAHATALYSSVLARARQTAEIIAPAVGAGRFRPVEDCGVCELHPGEADGLVWEQFLERYEAPDWDRDPDTVIAPGGESWSGFVDRAAAALAGIAERHPGGTAVVVCHAGVIESAMLRFLPVGGRLRLGLRTRHASLTEFELELGSQVELGSQLELESADQGPDAEHAPAWRLLRYNDAAHLPSA